MQLKVWLHGLAAAAIGAFSTSITVLVVDPTKFNFSGEGFLSLAKVSIVAAIVAVAGYLAKSPLPEEAATTGQAQKLGALLLCSVLLMGTTTGCTGQDVATVVKNISIYAQEAQPIVTQVITLVSLFTATQSGALSDMQRDNAKIQTDLKALVTLCDTYTAHPSDSVWQQIVTSVDALVTEGDTALMQLAGVKSDDSQKAAIAALASLDALLHTIDGFVQSTETPGQVKATAFRRTVKLQTISQYWADRDKERIAVALGHAYPELYSLEIERGF